MPEPDQPDKHQDLATLLSLLPACGANDDVTRVIDLYETAERHYRATIRATSPTIGSSASTNQSST